MYKLILIYGQTYFTFIYLLCVFKSIYE